MIRVLQVYPQMNNAGTERVIFNLYENIDTTKVQFDFLVEKPGELDDKICSMGGKIYYLYQESKNRYYKKLLEFFEKHPEYRIVHAHTHARMSVVLKAAKQRGIPCRIAHSHNARNDLPKIVGLVKGIMSIPIELSANYFFACSENAAKWLFPHRIKECKILYNGIKLESYLFNEITREKIRTQLGIRPDELVLIHVGRFATQKNHKYLIEIFAEYRKKTSHWKALLVGDGPLKDSIEDQVKKDGLEKNVMFLGNRSDVNCLYSAADVFVFPSLHEGLGIVVIEAQASGLPCVVSNAVPAEADLEIGLLQTLVLKNQVANWVETITKIDINNENRKKYKKTILKGKYNIKNVSKEIEKFYLEHGK